MKKYFNISLLTLALLISSCSNEEIEEMNSDQQPLKQEINLRKLTREGQNFIEFLNSFENLTYEITTSNTNQDKPELSIEIAKEIISELSKSKTFELQFPVADNNGDDSIYESLDTKLFKLEGTYDTSYDLILGILEQDIQLDWKIVPAKNYESITLTLSENGISAGTITTDITKNPEYTDFDKEIATIWSTEVDATVSIPLSNGGSNSVHVITSSICNLSVNAKTGAGSLTVN